MSGVITDILRRYGDDPEQLGRRLMPQVYDVLLGMARGQMAGERRRITLQPTALVHEAYLRLAGNRSWQNRRHFFGACGEAMRRVLIEAARRRGRVKRGGERQPVTPGGLAQPGGTPDEELLALDEALVDLEALAPRKALVVKLRYFAGLSIDETAAALEVSPATVKLDWSFAKAWLHRRLGRSVSAGCGDRR
ncbi:MAG: RNA polymerase subunit sigma [bacterium]|nr:RNA polymerase subunit sigma [bacterium]